MSAPRPAPRETGSAWLHRGRRAGPATVAEIQANSGSWFDTSRCSSGNSRKIPAATVLRFDRRRDTRDREPRFKERLRAAVVHRYHLWRGGCGTSSGDALPVRIGHAYLTCHRDAIVAQIELARVCRPAAGRPAVHFTSTLRL